MTTDDGNSKDSVVTLANVQVATGRTKRDTRSRLMRAFNTPFFPDIFVCSQVSGDSSTTQSSEQHRFRPDETGRRTREGAATPPLQPEAPCSCSLSISSATSAEWRTRSTQALEAATGSRLRIARMMRSRFSTDFPTCSSLCR